MVQMFDTAIQHGVNLIDIGSIYQEPFFPALAKALDGRRDQVFTQSHFGMVYKDGRCGPSKRLDEIKAQLRYEFQTLHADYTDFGLIHCIDDLDEVERVLHGGLLDYMKGLKAEGVIRHLGFSSHNPEAARRILDSGVIDLFMFSINPFYDFEIGNYANGNAAERAKFYRECKSAELGITVMKPYAGGQLLDGARSQFKQALTTTQCIQYALDRPAVLSVLPGIRNLADLQDALDYLEATPAQKDYSVISSFTDQLAEGVCVYCDHCLPCPVGMDIGRINKYYDLALTGDQMAADHYRALSVKASACVQCGHCEKACPFHVGQMARMKEIAQYFGEEIL